MTVSGFGASGGLPAVVGTVVVDVVLVEDGVTGSFGSVSSTGVVSAAGSSSVVVAGPVFTIVVDVVTGLRSSVVTEVLRATGGVVADALTVVLDVVSVEAGVAVRVCAQPVATRASAASSTQALVDGWDA
jgi:hypothetical protein